MRNLSKKRLVGLTVFISVMMLGIGANAQSRCFAYDFTHHIAGYVYYGNRDTIKITYDVDSWGGSSKFIVKQTKGGIFSKKTLDKKNIYKKNGKKQSIKFDNHGGCQYELWKAEDGKRIKGFGKIIW